MRAAELNHKNTKFFRITTKDSRFPKKILKIQTSSVRLLTSKTVLKCWVGSLNPATPKAAAVLAGDRAKLPRGSPRKFTNIYIVIQFKFIFVFII